MKKFEVKKALDDIVEMSDTEITANADFIRIVALEAYSLIKSLEKPRKKSREGG